jgi:hypothetical protein
MKMSNEELKELEGKLASVERAIRVSENRGENDYAVGLLTAERDRLTAAIAEQRSRAGLWRPKDVETYWYTDIRGGRQSARFDNDPFDMAVGSFGNCYQTMEQERAAAAIKRRCNLALSAYLQVDPSAGHYIPGVREWFVTGDYEVRRWNDFASAAAVCVCFCHTREQAEQVAAILEAIGWGRE